MEMEWEHYEKSEESNRRSKNPSRKKKQKKHKKQKKQKKLKKQKRDKKERMDIAADGSLLSSSEKEADRNKNLRKDNCVSSSEKEVNGNIDNLSTKSCCSCVLNNNGKKMYVRRPCQIPTDKSSDDDVDYQKADFQRMVSFNSNDKCCDGDNPPPASISKMQLVLNKLRPYLSLRAEDEPNLVKRLNDLGVEGINDLKLINFETDLQGIMKVIQCRKLKLELSKDIDVTMHENINTHSEIHNSSTSSVEHKRAVVTQPTEKSNFKRPRFKENVRKLLETSLVSNDERLYVIKTGYVLDVERTQECRKIVNMFEKQFRNGLKNKKSNQRYGTHSERHAPTGLPVGETEANQNDKKTWLNDMYVLHTKKEKINWDVVTRYMDMTYALQRQTITCGSGSIRKILLDWPFLGKELYLKNHFYYLTNTEETALNSFYKTIPTMFKFIQAEAEKEQENSDLQIKLMAIIKNNSNKNAYDEFLTVLLCYMAVMKENAEHMFIVINDTQPFHGLLSIKNIHSSPVVYCLGDIWSNPQCYVIVDNQCLGSVPMEIQEAIQIMFMSYYVFNLKYPTELAGILQFLQSYMFNIKDESNKIEKCIPKLLILMENYDNYVKKKVGDGEAERTTARL